MKLLGMVLIALIPVAGYDVVFHHLTLPLIGNHDIGWVAYPITSSGSPASPTWST